MDTQRRTAYLLIALGVLFLIGQLAGGVGWPLFVVAPGLVMLAGALLGPRSASGLAVPGSVVTVVGLILFVQDATARYDTWSYAWGLVLAAVGVGVFLHASIENLPARQREGVRLATLGLGMFAVFGVFFEFLLFGSALRGASGWILPLLLILGGAWMLARRVRA